MKLLVTGTAGFIGYHLTRRLAQENHQIICIDNINDYYDVDLKYGRLRALGLDRDVFDNKNTGGFAVSSIFPNFRFKKMDLCELDRMIEIFSSDSGASSKPFDVVVHLAAQAGVRYSLTNPSAYISGNVQGFLNVLEAAKLYPPKHLIYASSSSVYGLNTKIPFSEVDAVNQPVSLYAVTKRSNELMAHTYSHLYNIPTTGLRFFTVYGPWGRPDMAPFIFTKAILEGKPIDVFNNGDMKRDFTFIDDIIEGIIRVINMTTKESEPDVVPASIYNIGNGTPVHIMDFIHTLEYALGRKAVLNFAPMQPGDVCATWADCSVLEHDTGFRPYTSLTEGIKSFIEWYKIFYS